MSSKQNYAERIDEESSIETRVPIRCTNEHCNGHTPETIPKSKLEYAHCPSCEGNIDEQTGSLSWKESYEHFQKSQDGNGVDEEKTRFHGMDDDHVEVIHEDENKIVIRIRHMQMVEKAFESYTVSRIIEFDNIDGTEIILKRGDDE